jgi:hypothetical protein
MDQELIAYLDEHFARQEERATRLEVWLRGNTLQVEILRKETTRHFERIDETVEELREGLFQLAEGMVGVDESLRGFQKAVAQDIGDVLKLIRSVYSVMNQRLQSVEIRQDLQGRDPIQILRERYGKPSEQASPTSVRRGPQQIP